MTAAAKPTILEIDARGHRCPVPSLRLRRALERAQDDALIRLLADDPLARIDVPHLLKSLGHELVETQQAEAHWAFTARKTPRPPPSG